MTRRVVALWYDKEADSKYTYSFVTAKYGVCVLELTYIGPPLVPHVWNVLNAGWSYRIISTPSALRAHPHTPTLREEGLRLAQELGLTFDPNLRPGRVILSDLELLALSAEE